MSGLITYNCYGKHKEENFNSTFLKMFVSKEIKKVNNL